MDTDTRPRSLFLRNAERLISLFPKERRPGLLLTAGILYINYYQVMKLLTFGLYGRRWTKPREAKKPPRQEVVATSRPAGLREFAPYPPSQYSEKLTYEEWMTETIAFFRSVAFFARFRSLDDRQVLERLHQKREKEIRDQWAKLAQSNLKDEWVAMAKTETGEQEVYHSEPDKYPGSIPYPEYARLQMGKHLQEIPFDRKNDLADLWIAMEDKTRVWYCDLEQTAGPDSDDYVRAIKAWTKISRGVFKPTGITETWTPIDDYDYRLEIRFQWQGAPHSLEITTPTEWINLAVLEKINELIRESGMQYCVYKAFDQGAYIMVLTPAEKAALEQKRGWHFSP